MRRIVVVAVVMAVLAWGQVAQAVPIRNYVGAELVGGSDVNVGAHSIIRIGSCLAERVFAQVL